MNPERRRFLMVLGGAGALTGLGMWALPAGLKSARRTSRALGSEVSMTALHEQQENAERAIADARPVGKDECGGGPLFETHEAPAVQGREQGGRGKRDPGPQPPAPPNV